VSSGFRVLLCFAVNFIRVVAGQGSQGKSGNGFGQGEVREKSENRPFTLENATFVHFNSLVRKLGAMFNTLILSLKNKLLFHFK